jgi:hypothetical protein
LKAAKCPSCGCQRDGGDECLHCGIVFAKYFIRAQPAPPPPHEESNPPRESPGILRSIVRPIRWMVLASSVMVLYLLLQPAPAPIIDYQPSAAQSAEVKIRNFRRASLSGRAQRLHLSEAELNGWLEGALRAEGTDERAAPSASRASAEDEAREIDQTDDYLSAVRDVRVKLIDDRLRAYVRFVVYGKLLSFELEGTVSARDGYLHLDPVAGRLGSLPLPGLTLTAALDHLLQTPEKREVLRIPEYVRAVGVDGGQLLVNFTNGGL